MDGITTSFRLPTTHSSSQRISHEHRTNTSSQNNYSGYGIPLYFAARRHKKILRDNLKAAINKPTIRRLARRGGIIRIKSDIYPTVQNVVRDRLKLLIKHAYEIVMLSQRKTMTALDVVYALRLVGSPIYGFGMIEKGEGIADHAARYREKKRRQAENRNRVARELALRSATRIHGDDRRFASDVREGRANSRELKDQRVDHLLRQMKRGARC